LRLNRDAGAVDNYEYTTRYSTVVHNNLEPIFESTRLSVDEHMVIRVVTGNDERPFRSGPELTIARINIYNKHS
jgi:hypothetical protein